jgi:hypothetical protein
LALERSVLMRWKTSAIALACLLSWDLSASADTFTMNGTGDAYDVQGNAGFTFTGTGLSVDVASDSGPGDITGLVPGQSYSLSYTVSSEYFSGQYGGRSITGNGWITWQFNLVVPDGPNPSPSVQVPGTVAGSFSFCSPAEFEEVSSCGPEDNPLGSVAFTGTGTDTVDLACGSGTCGIYADYLEPYTDAADITTVPEPPTLVLILGSLLVYPMLLYFWRPSSRRIRQVRSS